MFPIYDTRFSQIRQLLHYELLVRLSGVLFNALHNVRYLSHNKKSSLGIVSDNTAALLVASVAMLPCPSWNVYEFCHKWLSRLLLHEVVSFSS